MADLEDPEDEEVFDENNENIIGEKFLNIVKQQEKKLK